MSWHQLELTLRPEQLEATSALLFELGCAGIEEAVAPSELRSSWEPAVEGAPTQARVLRASFADPDRGAVDAALAATRPLTSAWSELPDVDWSEAWKAQHPPVQLTPRLVVAPPWNAPAGALVIEPGQGFGTGQHPTTGMVARALEELAPGAAPRAHTTPTAPPIEVARPLITPRRS